MYKAGSEIPSFSFPPFLSGFTCHDSYEHLDGIARANLRQATLATDSSVLFPAADTRVSDSFLRPLLHEAASHVECVCINFGNVFSVDRPLVVSSARNFETNFNLNAMRIFSRKIILVFCEM